MDRKQFDLQKDVRDSCDDVTRTLKELHEWTKEIKEKERAQQKTNAENETIPPVRSQVVEPTNAKSKPAMNVNVEKGTKGNGEKPQSPVNAESSKKELANASKEKGNNMVKLGQFEEAINHYNNAIAYFDSDPIFYTNRALCYLRLERYEECIEDCNTAIKIDSKCIKAFYRRMKAYESLGDVEKSLNDCNQVLTLDPGNLDAKQSQLRISKRKNTFNYNLMRSFQDIRDGTKVTEPTWTQIGGYMKEIPVTTKPPHLRSQKPLKRVPVEDTLPEDMHLNEIPKEVIDKLFNSNDCGSFKQVDTKEKKTCTALENKESEQRSAITSEQKPAARKKETVIMPVQRKIDKVPDCPKTHAEFYSTWKELAVEQKYEYFKKIESSNVLKILGAGFDVDTLSEILSIMTQQYIPNKADVSVLSEICKHDEMPIISMFLSDNDREALKKIVEYMRQMGSGEDTIKLLNDKFGVSY